MSSIPSQDATTDQVYALTRGAEAKHPTLNNDEASDTEWPKPPGTGNRRKPVTYKKKQAKTKLQQQHLYTKDDAQERSHQSFDFVQIVCQTEKLKQFELVEMSGYLFDSTD